MSATSRQQTTVQDDSLTDRLLPAFGILILNYNGRQWLPGLYESLRADGYEQKRVYLFDNGSSDDSIELTKNEYPEVTILQLPENLGYTGAYNVAMRQAFADGCDWVSWQNSDTLVLPGWLDRMAEVAASEPGIGIMGPVFRDWQSDGPNYYMKGRRPEVIPFMEDRKHPPVDCDWVEGSALLVSRKCVEDVGPLDERLFMYWEEADFCRRARHHGWRVVIVPGSVNRHYGGGSQDGSTSPKPTHRLKLRNHYVYKLCDPRYSFPVNLAAMCGLHLTYQKHAVIRERSLPQFWANARAFAETAAGIGRWLAKHRDDRNGIQSDKLDA